MTPDELARVAARGATLVTCPRSNRHTGAGDPPIEAFYRSGVNVAVGTDSLASAPDLNLFSELAALRRLAPKAPAAALLDSATRQVHDFQARIVVLAASAPRVGPDQAWRRKLNLRGPTSLLFQVVSAGPLAVRIAGPNVRTSLAPLLGAAVPRADGRQPDIFDLEPGWYQLRLDPVDKAAGILDLLIGPPGLVPEPGSTTPRSSIALGRYELDKGAVYQVLANSAPGLIIAPVARALAPERAQVAARARRARGAARIRRGRREPDHSAIAAARGRAPRRALPACVRTSGAGTGALLPGVYRRSPRTHDRERPSADLPAPRIRPRAPPEPPDRRVPVGREDAPALRRRGRRDLSDIGGTGRSHHAADVLRGKAWAGDLSGGVAHQGREIAQ